MAKSAYRALLNWLRLSEANFLVLCRSVVSMMTNNLNFPDANPDAASLKLLVENFAVALDAAKTGDYLSIAKKNTAKTALVKELRRLTAYVNYVANGNREMLVSTGLPVSSGETTAKPLVQPSLTLSDGPNPASDIAVKAKGNGKVFVFWITESDADDAAWTIVASSGKQAMATGLKPGTKYFFKVATLGANNQLAVSNIASRVTQ